MNKIVRCFLDADMRCQHSGLKLLAKKANVDVTKINNTEHVIFINRARNRLKMYSSNNVLSYLKLDKGFIDLSVISKIPQAFISGDIEMAYTKALKNELLSKLGPPLESIKPISPLEIARRIKKHGLSGTP